VIAAAAGNLVGARDVLRETAEAHLLAAGSQMRNIIQNYPWTETELRRQIKNGLDRGVTKPLQADRTNAEWWAENLLDDEAFEALLRLGQGADYVAPEPKAESTSAKADPGGEAAPPKAQPAEGEAEAGEETTEPKAEAPADPIKDGVVNKKAKSKRSTKTPQFSMSKNGLWKLSGDDDPPVRISQSFELLGLARGAPNARGETDSWGTLVRFRNRDDKTRDVIISFADLHADVGPLCGLLADKGMDIERSDPARKAFATFLLKTVSQARVMLAPRTVWATVVGERLFVLPSESITGRALTERVVLAASATCSCEASGTLEGWKTGVASLATGNVLAVLSISSAFASPLLRLAGYESGGIHLWGPSSIGKTTLARGCASVWSRGDETGGFGSWRATANGLDGTLAGASDIGLAFDEISMVDGAELYQMIYMIAGGVGKARMNRAIRRCASCPIGNCSPFRPASFRLRRS
jgi:Domain of unknown function (DUF927)